MKLTDYKMKPSINMLIETINRLIEIINRLQNDMVNIIDALLLDIVQ